jgi:hypothetical protein
LPSRVLRGEAGYLRHAARQVRPDVAHFAAIGAERLAAGGISHIIALYSRQPRARQTR